MTAAVPSDECRFDQAAHAYWCGSQRWPSVTQALVRARLIDFDGVPWPVLEAARKRGQRVHQALHYWAQGDLDLETLGPQTRGYVGAALAWHLRTGFRPLNIEEPVFDLKRRFGGTPDLVGEFPDGSLAIPDYKTGAPSPGHALQLAAYASTKREPRRYRRIAIYLKPDGAYSAVEFLQRDYATDLGYFYSALNCTWYAISKKAMDWI